MKKNRIAITIFALVVLFGVSTLIPFSKKLLEPAPIVSLKILDREGRLLREVLSDEEGRARWVSLEQVPQHLISATLAAEDSRFYRHPGIDPLALSRALVQNIKKRRVVSGASTITQQVVRNILHSPRTLPHKIREAWYALRLEGTISKNEILAQYLNRVPYGNQTFGIEAASHLYFAKPASHLSLAESAFLAGLTRSPSGYDPFRHFLEAKKRQEEILRRMLNKRMTDYQTYQRALSEPLNLCARENSFRAPHFCDWVLGKFSPGERRDIGIMRTTLDLTIQEEAEKLLANRVKSLKRAGVTNGAIIVMDNQTGDILAMVGSVDFFDRKHDGQVNGTLSLRQPGSTLKPFTYGLALENGLTPATIIPDVETHAVTAGGDFTPRNYDGKFHGPVRLRTALASSYNVPAVRVLENLGADLLLERLHQAGFVSLRESPIHYGLGLTLGNGEVTLLELVHAYRALAKEGTFQKERAILEMRDSKGKSFPCPLIPEKRRVFSPQVSYFLTHILSDNDARIPAFGLSSPLDLPFPCAVKTGTSKDFRDNWTIGYTPHYTVGVWIGNFDGTPMRSVSGISGAAPLFHDVITFLERDKDPRYFPSPAGLKKCLICPLSGKIPGPHCSHQMEEIFIEGSEPKEVCDFHRLIRLDRRNGLVATKDCPKELIEERVFEVFPPLYQSWVAKERIPLPPQRFSSLSGELDQRLADYEKRSESKYLAIAFPDEGDIFKIDPVLRRNYQNLRLEAIVPEEINRITWLIDGQPFTTTERPFIAWWPLTPGRHQVEIRTKDNKFFSQTVNFLVLN